MSAPRRLHCTSFRVGQTDTTGSLVFSFFWNKKKQKKSEPIISAPSNYFVPRGARRGTKSCPADGQWMKTSKPSSALRQPTATFFRRPTLRPFKFSPGQRRCYPIDWFGHSFTESPFEFLQMNYKSHRGDLMTLNHVTRRRRLWVTRNHFVVAPPIASHAGDEMTSVAWPARRCTSPVRQPKQADVNASASEAHVIISHDNVHRLNLT